MTSDIVTHYMMSHCGGKSGYFEPLAKHARIQHPHHEVPRDYSYYTQIYIGLSTVSHPQT